MNKIFLSLVIVLLAQNVFAWGYVGHYSVGLIASEHLTAEAQQEVRRLLGDESLAKAANWADSIKSGSQYKQATWYHFEKIKDGQSFLSHFKNMPEAQRKKGGVITAILMAMDNLKNPRVSPTEKKDSLRFLVHFVGDLHQPLHSGRPDDNGGVKVDVTWFGQPMNLHKVWDSAMLETSYPLLFKNNTSLDQTSIQYVDFLKKKFRNQTTATEFDIETWLNESMSLREEAYSDLIRSNQKKYQQLHIDEVDLRIYEGGLRLAEAINFIYSNRPLPSRAEKFWTSVVDIAGDLKDIVSLKP